MPFKAGLKRKIVRDAETGDPLGCVMCGRTYPLPDAVHIIDQKEWAAAGLAPDEVNGIPLCPNHHRVYDDLMRPYLYKALQAYGATGLPKTWSICNKMSHVTDQKFPLDSSGA